MGEVWDYASHSTYRASPKFSFTSAPQTKDKSKGSPGPGEYGFISTDKDKFSRSSSFSMGASSREGGKAWSTMPGPGAYTPVNPNLTAPRWAFSTDSRLRAGKKASTPGPGRYHSNTTGMGGVEMSFSGRPDGKRRSHTPGPGAYKPSHEPCSHIASAPKLSFGASSRTELKMSKTPGPGSYESFSAMGGNPAMKTAAKYSMKGRYNPPASDITPGPVNTGTQFK
mmetsp:Transcript_59527/g.134186  ORF Transcript_59527/g.134186 Transcript_59527/m.134186 type:complete len:225 (+) Transcript_59527:132-806(+)